MTRMVPPPDDESAKTVTERIRDQNDAFRSALGAPCPIPGRVVMTHTVAALDPPIQFEVLLAVKTFTEFESANDPYGEHDFGAFEIRGETYYFKLDYYAPDLEFGSEDPSDPKKTVRVLTIMHARDY